MLLTIHSSALMAQTVVEGIEVKTQTNTYINRGSTTGTRSLVAVYKKNSIPSVYSTRDLKLYELSRYEYTADKPISKSVFEVFKINRLKELAGEVVIIKMYIDSLGKVLAIEYLINSKSKLTPIELERFEEVIKQKVSFKIPQYEKISEPLKPVVQSIHISKLLDHSFPY